MPALKFEQFNPLGTVRRLTVEDASWLGESQMKVDASTVEELIALNKHWFAQPMGMIRTVGWLWLISTRFTDLGIAPAWRGAPARVRVKVAPSVPARSSGPRPIGDTASRNQVRRWIDLQWLRSVLGPDHKTLHEKWKDAVSADIGRAEETWVRINALYSSGAGTSNNVPGSETPRKVLFGLDVPMLVRLGLNGLINRDAGKLLTNARKRVAKNARPALEKLMCRSDSPLTRQEVDQRLIATEAIELARGSPADAAQVYGWITGKSISKQSMHAMRVKIAAQCGLSTRAWQSPSRARTNMKKSA